MLHPYYMEENYGWGHRKILLCSNRTLSTLSPELCEKVRRGRREIFTLSPFDCEKRMRFFKAHPFLYRYLKSRERLLLCGALLQRQHRFGKLVADPDKQTHRGQVVQKEENERLLKVEKDKLRLQKQIGGDGTVEKGVESIQDGE